MELTLENELGEKEFSNTKSNNDNNNDDKNVSLLQSNKQQKTGGFQHQIERKLKLSARIKYEIGIKNKLELNTNWCWINI